MMCYRDMTFCEGSRSSNRADVCATVRCWRHISQIPEKVLRPGRGDFAWPIAWADFRPDCKSYTKV